MWEIEDENVDISIGKMKVNVTVVVAAGVV